MALVQAGPDPFEAALRDKLPRRHGRKALTINGPAALGERRRRKMQMLALQSSDEPDFLKDWKRRLATGAVGFDIGDGTIVAVQVDPVKGPKQLLPDGSFTFTPEQSTWCSMPSSDQKLVILRVAKQNYMMQGIVDRKLEDDRLAQLKAQQEALEEAARRAAEEARAAELEHFLRQTPAERTAARCERERERAKIPWSPVSYDTVSNNSEKVAEGVTYGIVFPWSEDQLAEWGPGWLTKAFHIAGTLESSNRVTALTMEPKVKVTAGNNAGKFIFEVEYLHDRPDLHKKLFAKIPFPLSGMTKNDRQSSSVNKQPMDLYEINSYRLFESAMPMKVPKFYFGDISNVTTNYILILERVPFAEIGNLSKSFLAPGLVEGPYEKCKDFQLKSPAKDYYMQILRCHAKLGGATKKGLMGSVDFHVGNVMTPMANINDPTSWGMNPMACTGMPPKTLISQLRVGIKFFSETAKVIFPEYMTQQSFITKFVNTVMTLSAYSAEINYWKHSNVDYLTLGHQNLNMDNAYFWRDDKGKLDCGIFDFGGFGYGPLHHRIWWGFNCGEFEDIKENLVEYIGAFISMYQAYGGPELEYNVLKQGIIITALQNMMWMVAAIPDTLRMCPAKDWGTIQDRHDPRIAGDIGNKSTLRTTLKVLENGLRMIEEMRGSDLVQEWIEEVFVGQWGNQAKTTHVILGATASDLNRPKSELSEQEETAYPEFFGKTRF
mmetsp:Transcript_75238/g.166438  ORF Transcript_75238/g.166438 Transcript_75238/m.166438 type:complete len:719 (-) Transcript_75238:109-2265(-)